MKATEWLPWAIYAATALATISQLLNYCSIRPEDRSYKGKIALAAGLIAAILATYAGRAATVELHQFVNFVAAHSIQQEGL